MALLLDDNVVKEWNQLLSDIAADPEGNRCEGRDSGVIDACPQVQKLMFFMRIYYYYLGEECLCDEENEEKIEYHIESMTDTVNGLDEMDMLELLEIFEHVSTVHFEDALFEYFEEEIGKCGDGHHCELQHRKKPDMQRMVTTEATASSRNGRRNRGRDRGRDRGRERGRNGKTTFLSQMSSASNLTVDEEGEER